MSIQKELPELLQAGVITEETAEKIRVYYAQQKRSSNTLTIIFGILGALLTALGIILIVAHNWDELTKSTKTIFAFLPLVIGQLVTGFVLFKHHNQTGWKESATAFLFIAIGASIALVSQVYHLPGSLSSFLFLWMLLGFPLIYIMRSSIASLLFIAGITYYGAYANYFEHWRINDYWYWILFLGVLPHYYRLLKNNPQSNFTYFHNWLIPLSLTIILGSVGDDVAEILTLDYFALFSLFYLIGKIDVFSSQKLITNGYTILGKLGISALLIFTSFDFIWEDMRHSSNSFLDLFNSPETATAAILISLVVVLLILFYRSKNTLILKDYWSFSLPVFALLFMIGFSFPYTAVLVNLMILGLGIFTIQQGIQQNHLGILNYGLLFIAILAVCRFFDSDLSFVLRGSLFVLVGVGFFASNIFLIKKRKQHEN